MAGTFWKMSLAMCDQPEVIRLAGILHQPVYAAAALTALLYAWGAECAGGNGSINDFTEKKIESACGWEGARGRLVNAFCAAGILLGDPKVRDDGDPLRIAGWEEVAADVLRSREQARLRQRRSRSACDVTRDDACDVTPPKNYRTKEDRTKEQRTREREDCAPVRAAFCPPSENEVAAYCLEQGFSVSARSFVDYYASNGWKVGSNPMSDWRAAVRRWNDSQRIRTPNPALLYEQRTTPPSFFNLLAD